MGITRITTDGEIDAFMESALQRNERAAERIFFEAGEIAQNSSRLGGDYKDQTGNLRSSVGYEVSKDGSGLRSGGFVPNAAGTEKGSKGIVEGPVFAAKKASEARDGLALTVVAGMNYAEYVERKGYNVLSSSQREADAFVKRFMKRIS